MTHTPHEFQTTAPGLQGVAEAQGPLVRQTEAAARLARVLHHAAQELWDLCTYRDAAEMWEEARAVASRILAATEPKS